MSAALELPHATAAASSVPAVDVRGVNHYFGEGEARNQVLFDNHLQIAAGEIVIMTGPSGSGKTTLLTLIGGLRTLQEGSLKVYGREMLGLHGPKSRRSAARHRLHLPTAQSARCLDRVSEREDGSGATLPQRRRS